MAGNLPVTCFCTRTSPYHSFLATSATDAKYISLCYRDVVAELQTTFTRLTTEISENIAYYPPTFRALFKNPGCLSLAAFRTRTSAHPTPVASRTPTACHHEPLTVCHEGFQKNIAT
eukprot:scaffold263679_cov17-Prasinocladus_malaysianus.AAC.1